MNVKYFTIIASISLGIGGLFYQIESALFENQAAKPRALKPVIYGKPHQQLRAGLRLTKLSETDFRLQPEIQILDPNSYLSQKVHWSYQLAPSLELVQGQIRDWAEFSSDLTLPQIVLRKTQSSNPSDFILIQIQMGPHSTTAAIALEEAQVEMPDKRVLLSTSALSRKQQSKQEQEPKLLKQKRFISSENYFQQ